MVKEEEERNEPIVKMRGLPWSATVDDIISFLEANIKNGRAGVHITMSREGRPSGEAFVELETIEDLEKALKKDKQHMGHRYIEIFKTTRSDMDWYIERSGSNLENVMDECCIRLRGLPYGCTKDDISKFFDGLTIVPNGISFVSDQTGRNTGEAYVQFVNKEMVEKALKKHLDRIGHRYIEIFRSSLAEIRAQTGPKIRPLMSEFVPRPSPYDRGDRFTRQNRSGGRGLVAPRMRDLMEDDSWDDGTSWGGNVRRPIGMREPLVSPLSGKGRLSPPPAVRARNAMYGNGKTPPAIGGWEDEEQAFIVHMRGLPFRATEQDIMDFFQPLLPININIIYERGGRPSGEANVEFETYEDANQAMSKDKQNIHNRYIELFLRARPSVKKPPSLIGRNFPARADSGLQNDVSAGGPDSSLFSRRGAAVSNSAYDGFYGTSSYRATTSSGNYTR